MRDIEIALNIKNKDRLKNILYSNKITVKKGSTYILDESIFNKDEIICNNSYSRIKFNVNIYDNIIKKLKTVITDKDCAKQTKDKIDDNKENKRKSKPKLKVEDNKTITNIEDVKQLKNIVSKNKGKRIKDFVNNFDLKVSYNDVFRFLRSQGILHYIKVNSGKKINYPTEEYKKYFNCFINEYRVDGIYITLEGEQVISEILIQNEIITTKTT